MFVCVRRLPFTKRCVAPPLLLSPLPPTKTKRHTMDAFSPEMLECLVGHLTFGDVFRLLRALGRRGQGGDCYPDLAPLLALRMGLRPRARRHGETVSELAARMRTSRSRCVECAGPTRCLLRVCVRCTEDGFFALCTRYQARQMYLERTGGTPKGYLAAVFRPLQSTPHAKRGRLGKYYYWRKDVEALMPPEIAEGRHQRDARGGE